MKISIKKLIYLWKVSDKYITLPILSSVICSLIILSIFLLNYNNLPNRLPLLYSFTWGESQLVSKPQFIILPLSSIFITLINLGISWQIHQSQYVIKRTLSLNLLLVNLLLLITALKILSIFI